MSYLTIIARGTATIFLGRIVSLVLSAFTSIFLARLLGPEIWGSWNLSTTIFSIVVAISANFGINEGLTRYVAEYMVKKEYQLVKNIVSTAFILKGLFGLLSGCGLYFLATPISLFFKKPQLIPFLYVIALVLIIGNSFSLLASLFQGLQHMKAITTLDITKQCFILILSVGIYLVTKNAILSFLGNVSGAIFADLLGIMYIFKTMFPLSEHKSKINQTKRLLSYGVPLSIFSIIQIFSTKIDMIFLGLFRSSIEIGWYAVAFALAAKIQMISVGLSTVLFPVMTEIHTLEDEGRIEDVFMLSTKYSVIVAIFLGACGFSLGAPLIILLYSEAYLPAVASFQILLFRAILRVATVGVSPILLAFKKQKWLLYIQIPEAGVAFILCLILVPIYGTSGAATALVCSSFLGFILGLIFVRYNTNISPSVSFFLKPLFSAVITVLVLNFIIAFFVNITLQLILGLLSGFCLYFLLLRLIGGITSYDIRVIKKALHDIF